MTSRIPDRLIQGLTKVRQRALELEHQLGVEIRQVEADYRVSARNLIHYLGVRQQDLRKLQADLSSLGLSSLGRLESHTLASLNAVLETLNRLAEHNMTTPVEPEAPVSFRMGPILLEDHAKALFGRQPSSRSVRIMVTMPSEAASSPDLVDKLLGAGMDVMRINCAHDEPTAWKAMVENLRSAQKRLGRSCRVLADLGGPKLRTGIIETVEAILKIRPQRDHRGTVIEPAFIWLTPAETPEEPPSDADAVLLVTGDLLSAVQAGDVIEVEDCREKYRTLRITAVQGTSRLAELRQTVYVPEGGRLHLVGDHPQRIEGRIARLPSITSPLVLYPEDLLILTRAGEVGRDAKRDDSGRVVEPARIACSLDAVFEAAKQGEPIWFDDGKIGGVITENDGQEIRVKITHARPQGSKLREDKGINLPETELKVPALTPKDIADLEILVDQIDLVGLSFVRHPDDVVELEDRLHALGGGHLGIVLKIENRTAFENLPQLLLAGLRSPPVGVMVARGDLAVELGFERLSEVQEEILWICEAAHVPVIWATQVLEDMAKTGIPSRAEVSDAAMSGRAECVMLNKGPYIVEAVEFLSDILERMETHQSKKTAMLSKLSISEVR